MTQLVWDAPGARYYESGVDRGVLYVDSTGYAWSGLLSVSEKSSGGDPQPYYLDGIKYLNVAAAEEYEATIEAVSSPKEFGQCDGYQEAYNGLFVTGQRRKSFGFCYRTRVGSDLNADLGYKLHIVYNALSAPAQKDNKTTGDTAEPLVLSWDITTTPVPQDGIKPTAHFVVDTRITHPTTVGWLEELLYGTEESSAYLPTVEELLALFAVDPEEE